MATIAWVRFSWLFCCCAVLSGCASFGGHERIPAEGTKLYVEVHGPRKTDTVLLFLHGGPGSGVSSLLGFRAYPGLLFEKTHFVAYLHQRGVMKSPPVPDSTQTIAMHVSDVDRVVQHLHKQYPDRRLIIIGHSWGGALALSYAAKHPEAPVDGLVLITTPIGMARNEEAAYKVALDWARDNGRWRAQGILESLGPPPYTTLEQMMEQRRWTRRAIPRPEEAGSLRQVLDAAGFDSVNPAWSRAEFNIARAMFGELMQTDLGPELPKIKWPMLAFAGGLDGTVMANLMLEDLQKYGGDKRTVIFEKGDHQLFMQEPQRFVDEVNSFIAQLNVPQQVRR